MTRRIPAPSPNGTNFEKLFLVRSRSGGALDSVKRHGDEDMPDHGELRTALEDLLAEHLGEGDALEKARGLLNEHLGSGEEFDHAVDEDDEPGVGGEAEGQGRGKMRQFMKERGASDEEIDELFARADDEGLFPKNATHGMGGRLREEEARDRRRMARDRRRRMAADAAYSRQADSLEKLFPESARIRLDGGS